MSDRPKIVAGLVVFVGVVTLPLWLAAAKGGGGAPPELELPEGGRCVESSRFMRQNHMQLLETWRDQVVREGRRVYRSAAYGTEHALSLSSTCLSCHESKERFCDRCHRYVGAQVDCWDCHLDPTAR